MGYPPEKIAVTLDHFGNCVAASSRLRWFMAIERAKRGDDSLLGSGASMSTVIILVH
jgi:3-oxoacyl-[acyl-carrier-protein] synthase III